MSPLPLPAPELLSGLLLFELLLLRLLVPRAGKLNCCCCCCCCCCRMAEQPSLGKAHPVPRANCRGAALSQSMRYQPVGKAGWTCSIFVIKFQASARHAGTITSRVHRKQASAALALGRQHKSSSSSSSSRRHRSSRRRHSQRSSTRPSRRPHPSPPSGPASSGTVGAARPPPTRA